MTFTRSLALSVAAAAWLAGPPAFAQSAPPESSLRLQVSPSETEVYVDGYYAGIADNFDGAFQKLKLAAGEHDITLYMVGHRTVTQKVDLQAGASFSLRHEMEPLQPGQTAEPRPAAPAGESPFRQSLVVVQQESTPWEVAADYKFTELDHETGQLAGGYAGRTFGDAVFLGGAAYTLVNGSGGDEFTYGGFLAGWTILAGSRIRFGARALVGAGYAQLGGNFVDGGRGVIQPMPTRFGIDQRQPAVDPRQPVVDHRQPIPSSPAFGRTTADDTVFIFEPQANLLTRISSHMSINWSGGYRLTGATDALHDRIDGATGSVGLQLEW